MTSTVVTGLNLTTSNRYYASVRAKDSSGAYSLSALGDGWTVTAQSIDCSGLAGGVWLGVPANPDVGQTDDFCVQKHAAKNVGGVPTSQADLTPWVDISQTDAIAKCDSIDPGKGYELITNEMWQTIARNIETAQSGPGVYLNWSGSPSSPADDNSLNRGHSDGTASLAADVDDSHGCAGYDAFDTYHEIEVSITCNDAWHVNKRTHTLSNGEVIWDLAGNVWEWTSSTLDHQGEENWVSANPANDLGGIKGKTEWGPTYDYSPNASPDPLAFEFPKTHSEYGGLGWSFLFSSEDKVFRGGGWDYSRRAGVFASGLPGGPPYSDAYTGFRCSYTP